MQRFLRPRLYEALFSGAVFYGARLFRSAPMFSLRCSPNARQTTLRKLEFNQLSSCNIHCNINQNCIFSSLPQQHPAATTKITQLKLASLSDFIEIESLTEFLTSATPIGHPITLSVRIMIVSIIWGLKESPIKHTGIKALVVLTGKVKCSKRGLNYP